MQIANQLIFVLKVIIVMFLTVWNSIRLIQTRHCWTRKEPCNNEECKWRNFCDKHGNSMFMDIYRLHKIEEHIKKMD